MVRIKKSAGSPLAVVRRRASRDELTRVVPEACGIAWNLAKARGIACGRLVALYLDDQINLEVGVELDTPIVGDGDLVASSTPAGTVASTVHYGPYNRLGEAHRAVRDWCEENGYRLTGPNWEIYGHWEDEWTEHPERIRTDVFYLVEGDRR